MSLIKLSELILEVSLLMGVPPVMDLPSVEVVSPAQIKKVCGHERALGCYSRPIIYLREEPKTTYQESVLVHVLVHHSQEMLGIGGTKWTCERFVKREDQAHQIQQQWLESKGISMWLPHRWKCND